jgi:hypothetical protein
MRQKLTVVAKEEEEVMAKVSIVLAEGIEEADEDTMLDEMQEVVEAYRIRLDSRLRLMESMRRIQTDHSLVTSGTSLVTVEELMLLENERE